MARLNANDAFQMLFWEECRDQIHTIEQELLSIEAETSNEESLHNIFRMAHSIKGSAATLELEDLKNLAHSMENLLTHLKSRRMSLTLDVMDALLYAIDQLKLIHKKLMESDEACSEVPLAISLIEQQIKRSHTAVEKTYSIKIIFDSEAELLSLKAFIVVNALTEISKWLTINPPDYENLEDEALTAGILIHLKTDRSRVKLGEILDGITELKVIEITEAEERCEAQAKKFAEVFSSEEKVTTVREIPKELSLDTSAVKVSVKRIDQLINLMGEFIIEKEALNNIVKTLKKDRKKDLEVQRLVDATEHISILSSELYEMILSTRMIPLEIVFNRFPRMVRDLSQKCNKNVQLTIEGKEISIDREIVESLVDPLTHILRNAIDHGIECECERIKQGKVPAASIKLSAKHESGFVVMEIEDDGKGINIEALRRKIVEKGLLTREGADQLETQDCLAYIFLPGFSTAAKVGEISGRGVGLDVVKSNINRLQGYVTVKSIENKGTTFIIKLPMTLAVIKAMLIRDSEVLYLVPKSSLGETFRLKGDEIEEKLIFQEGKRLLRYDDQMIPAKYLPKNFYDLDLDDKQERQWHNRKIFVLIIRGLEGKFALLVDEILGEQEVVIKSLRDYMGEEKLLGPMKGLKGASILGDGGLAYVLDPYFFF